MNTTMHDTSCGICHSAIDQCCDHCNPRSCVHKAAEQTATIPAQATVHDLSDHGAPTVANSVDIMARFLRVPGDPYEAAELLSNGGPPRLAWVVQSGDNTCVVLEEPRLGGAA